MSLTWNSEIVNSVINASISGMYLRFYEQHKKQKEKKQYFMKLKYADKGRKVRKIII
jgi:hypothetical protein|tara:strand:- start:1322 stop:1492 length:171 start_codon:yes stop_codon:yes gene_type:complete